VKIFTRNMLFSTGKICFFSKITAGIISTGSENFKKSKKNENILRKL
jgi:hypothetical protein